MDNNLFESLVNNINEAIYICDKEKNIIYMNPASEALTEWGKSDAIGKKCYEVFVYENEDCKNNCPFFDLNAGKNIKKYSEKVIITKSGHKKLTKISSSIIEDKTKKGKNYFGVILLDNIEDKSIEFFNNSNNTFDLWIKENCKKVLENTSNWEFWLSTNGKFLYSSPICEKITGYSQKEFYAIPDLLKKLIFSEDLDKVMKHIMGDFSGDESKDSIIFRIVNKNNEIVWLLHKCQPIYDDNGVLIGKRGCNWDITNFKNRENKLENERNKYSFLLDNLPYAVVETDTQGNFVYINKKGFELFGYDSNMSIEGLNIFQFLVSEDVPYAMEIFLKMSTNNEEYKTRIKEYRAVKNNGEVFYVLVDGTPIVNNHNEITGFLFVVIDINKYKSLEKELDKRKEYFSVTLDNLLEGIIVLNSKKEIIMANKSAEKILMLNSKYRNKEIDKLVKIDSNYDINTIITEVINTKIPKSIYEPLNLVLSNNIIKKININISPIMSSNELLGIMLVINDITEKENILEELNRIKQFELFGKLAGAIGHDYNNILTGIIGNLSLVKANSDVIFKDNKNEEITELFYDLDRAANQAKVITKKLLAFSKIDKPIKKVCSISNTVKEAVMLSIRGTNIIGHFDIAPNVYPIFADLNQISYLIENIAINSVESMPNGGNIHVSIKNIKSEKNEDYVEIIISDEGIGIPKEKISEIFYPYYTTKSNKLGLGLTTSYTIVKNHQGEIEIDSTIGKGTKVRIIFPAVVSEKEIVETETKEIIFGSGKILIMDDEPIIKKVLEMMLKYLGYDVYVASNCREMIEKYKESIENNEPFRAVIVDLTIEGMGGKEVIKRLTAVDPNVKAIVSSGYSNDEALIDYVNYGFKGSIAKPYTLEEISHVLHKVLSEE